MLDGIRERLARDEVGSSLDARGGPLAGRLDVDGNRRGSREVAEGRREPVVEPGRANAGGDLPEVGDRRSDLRDDLIERRRENSRFAGQAQLETPDLHAERDEALLRPVVEVALEPTALLVAGLDDACARSLDLGELDPYLDAEARHLDRERGGGEDAIEQVATFEQRRIVQQRRGLACRRG